MIKHIIFNIIFFIALNSGFSRNINLGNNQWYFKQANQKSKWLPANVPGNIHSDLLFNKLKIRGRAAQERVALPKPTSENNKKKGCGTATAIWVTERSS